MAFSSSLSGVKVLIFFPPLKKVLTLTRRRQVLYTQFFKKEKLCT